MTRNNHSIARNFNAAMEEIGRTIRPKSITPRVYIDIRVAFRHISQLFPSNAIPRKPPCQLSILEKIY